MTNNFNNQEGAAQNASGAVPGFSPTNSPSNNYEAAYAAHPATQSGSEGASYTQAPSVSGDAPSPQQGQAHAAAFAGNVAYAGAAPGETYAQYAAYDQRTEPFYGQPQKKSHGWIVAIVCIVAICALIAVSISSCSKAIESAVGTVSSSSYTTVNGPSVAIIDIDGTIEYDGTSCSPEGLKYLLDEAEADSNIVAVVLRVNSGGGTSTAGEEMSTYVSQFSKPVVVSSAATNASAAYEISSQADYIFTAQSTAIGCIGTVIQFISYEELAEKLGINIEDITSSDSKDSSYGTRDLTDEERAWYQNMVDQINDMFIQNVADGRNMTLDEVRALANGLPYTGVEAVENGLADEIGTLEDAVAKASELAGYTNLSSFYLTTSSSDLMSLLDVLGQSNSSSLTDQISALLGENYSNGSLE